MAVVMLSVRAHAILERTRAARVEIDTMIASYATSGDPDHPEHGSAMDLPTLDEIVFEYTGRVLAAADGNKSEAARVLGVDRSRPQRILVRQGRPTLAGGKREGAGRPARRAHAATEATAAP
jgi:ActR/RegA family two-component response regulator